MYTMYNLMLLNSCHPPSDYSAQALVPFWCVYWGQWRRSLCDVLYYIKDAFACPLAVSTTAGLEATLRHNLVVTTTSDSSVFYDNTEQWVFKAFRLFSCNEQCYRGDKPMVMLVLLSDKYADCVTKQELLLSSVLRVSMYPCSIHYRS